MGCYIDHVCYFVTDLDWAVRFFENVYGMSVERTKTADNGIRDVWMSGGLQLREAPDFDGTMGQSHHVCLLVDDLEAVRAKALEWGCSEMPQHHWVKMPDGLMLEMFVAAPGALETLNGLKKKA